jgi:P pilus assembly chaperone PapD
MKTEANSLRCMRICSIIMLLMTYFVWDTAAQKISTSPTRVNYKISPGGSGRSRITVANNSADRQGFQVTFGDFSASVSGKSQFSKEGTENRSCASWLTATPAVFELEPGETQDIQVMMDVPADSSALIARWAVAYVQLRAPENDGKGSGEGLKVQVTQSYRFGVYLFQTPPSVTESKGEIKGLNYENDVFTISMKNAGETFLKCNSYIELTNLSTGETKRVTTRGFTMLPALNRNTVFKIPNDIPPGRYSVLAVMDYGSRDEVEAAEMEITIPEKGNQHK